MTTPPFKFLALAGLDKNRIDDTGTENLIVQVSEIESISVDPDTCHTQLRMRSGKKWLIANSPDQVALWLRAQDITRLGLHVLNADEPIPEQ